MTSPVIENGPHTGEPILQLQRPDGSPVLVWERSEIPAAFLEALGPIPYRPWPPGMLAIVTWQQIGNVTTIDPLTGSEVIISGVAVPNYTYQPIDATAEVEAYKAELDAWIARAGELRQVIFAALPPKGEQS